MEGHLDLVVLTLAAGVTLVAAVVKGAVGFAMPMIMISGLASFLPADQALALLILPTFLTNLVQAVRQGIGPALASARDFRVLLVLMVVFVILSAQAVPHLPKPLLLGILGGSIVIFAASQLAGYQFRFDGRHRTRAEVLTGIVGGIYGGVTGVWGPPMIALLVSLDLDKRENVRVQGVAYLVGAAALLVGYAGSGVLTGERLAFSAILGVPALAGLSLGFAIQDRLDARRFRRWTLVVLAVTGTNLLRRALGF